MDVHYEKDGNENNSETLLREGDSGESVLEIQKSLNLIGYNLNVDGQYGMTTQWYVKDFQLQVGLIGNGAFNTETKSFLRRAKHGEVVVDPSKWINLNVTNQTVTNPDDLLVLVNKKRNLPSDYIPNELVQPNVPHVNKREDLPNKKMQRVPAGALEELFKQAKQDGLQLVALSGFRSYETQGEIFSRNVEKKGEEKANQYSARPGQSEHQTGLAMDVTSPAVQNQLVTAFEETREGKWIQEHAVDYGFIIRYLRGKEKITGYQYEPWHLRYVGKDVAKAIFAQNLTLEEFLLRNENLASI